MQARGSDRRAQGRRWPGALAAAVGLAAGAASVGCGAGRTALPAARADTHHPNVVVIVTDDETLGSVGPRVTPNIYRWFVQRGRSYPNFYVADPLCAPSRATTMTGRYNHNNGVRDNDRANFGLGVRSQIQCSLQEQGYTTGLFGKFYNAYDHTEDPPCLSDYAVTRGDVHAGLEFRVDGETVTPAGWQDDYIDQSAVGFLDGQAEHPSRPFYLYEALLEPHAPYHGLPASVAGRPVPAPFVSPSVRESPGQMAGMAPVVRAHALATRFDHADWNAQERMMMDVDRYVGNVFAALKRNGQLKNTLVVFLSDNGQLFGEHHLSGKRLPYTEAMGVPAYVYGPAWVGSGASTDGRLTTNADIAPTIIQATGIEPRLRHPLDGRSLLDPSWSRPYLLGESWHLSPLAWEPRWRSIRSKTFQYIEYLTDGPHPRVTFREYYDLTADPYELRNLLADRNPANDPDVALLHARTVAAAHCRGTDGALACP